MAPSTRTRRSKSSPTRDAERASRHRHKGVARYYRLYELLSAALQDGTIAPQSALPSEPELCARHGISRTTVRRALDRLEREGRIVRRRGSGTYARPRRVRPRLRLELHALPEMLQTLESHTHTTTLRSDTTSVPQALRALASDIGSTAHVIEQLLSNQGEALSLTSTYLAEGAGRGVHRPIRRPASLVTVLARFGKTAAAVSYTLGAVAADADAARALQVPLGSPLLRLRAVLTGDGGELHAVLQSLCRSDRLQLKVLERQRT